MAGEVDKVAGRSEDALGTLRHFEASFGQRDLPSPSFHERRADLAFQFAYLHGQGRLRYRAVTGGPAEVPMPGKRG